ncbi:multicopper oxidase [Aplosporella prunicola CBS 121167]|uniref:Multicopper oxidase n=1 Tax=Aplosporella prunicola CBS 121167 TaxID=1176127 RepID=A0A6A6B1W9_9PEZI|nr:multicopper oxidase [Aplosporella prunicola CBS 121167]KAF2138179.1 multicopper oxidase [Aplosporella prunicola CBS 121167]
MKCTTLWSYLASVLTVGVSATGFNQSLPQHRTNGASKWGTLGCQTFPDFLTSNPLPAGFPWGDRSGLSNDPYGDVPNTGVTRYYDFNVARGYLSPDGYNKSGIFVNGEFPGPAIEANWGDMIEVRVHNNIDGPGEGTAFHWHGLTMKGTQWFDGVPGVSQCPIAPGSSFTYRFRADVYGTSWWHSHFSAQYTAGAFGPMIIYGPKHAPYDVDVGPLLLGDHYHRDYFEVVEDAARATEDFHVYVPASDNNLINGKNNYNCSMATTGNATCVSNAGRAQFRFQPGKVHRLRLMNIGAAALLHFSIDGHKMQVIAHDFEPVVPYEADFITLGAAQRTDILVTADADPNQTYWMRSTISANCSEARTTEALAVLSYEGNEAVQEEPRSRISAAAAAANAKDFLCRNDELHRTVPFFPKPVAEPDVTETIEVDLFTNETGHHVWIMNNRTQRTNYNEPVLLLADQGNSSFPSDWNVYDFGANRTIRIVLNTVYQSAHPMHLHGHSFQVLSEGPGAWDGTTIVNPANPARRDTHMQRRYGHLVIQFEADNPGAWSYHCHIAWHASMGYNIMIMERGDDLALTQGAIPMVMEQTCTDWKEWTSKNVVNQIDAGI